MGTTAEKINRLTQTKSDLKTVINYTGANITDETTFKEYPKLLNKAYIDILNDEGESLYNALPKVTGTGFNLTLDTEEGKMDVSLKGDTQQDETPTSDYPQDIEVVTGEQNIKIVGKNLLYSNLTYPFTTKGVTVTQEEDGSITLNGTQTGAFNLTYNNYYYNDIKDYEGKTITISLNATGTGGFRNFGIKRQTSPDLLIATSPVTSKSAILDLKGYTDIWFDIYFNNTSRTFVNYNIKPQIEVGSQATTYEPYQSQNYPINLGNIELGEIGDYQDYIYNQNGDWYLHKETNKFILNGTQNITAIAVQTNTTRVLYSGVLNSNPSTPENYPCFSNYFNYLLNWSIDKEGIYTNNNDIVFRINKEKATSKEEVNQILSQTNLEVLYSLKNSQDTHITDTILIQQLENLKNAKSYDNVTNIIQTNDNVPFVLEVSALSKIE